VLLDECIEVAAADLLFPFDEQFDIDRKRSFDLEKRFDAFEMNVDLALIVGRSTRVEPVITNRCFKRRRSPEFERLHRLHVVVSIDEYRWLAGRAKPLSINDGMSRSGKQLDILQTDRAHVVGNPLSASMHVLHVLTVGADAGDRKELFQFRKIPLFVRLEYTLQLFCKQVRVQFLFHGDVRIPGKIRWSG